jgi:hypothetical protein
VYACVFVCVFVYMCEAHVIRLSVGAGAVVAVIAVIAAVLRRWLHWIAYTSFRD